MNKVNMSLGTYDLQNSRTQRISDEKGRYEPLLGFELPTAAPKRIAVTVLQCKSNSLSHYLEPPMFYRWFQPLLLIRSSFKCNAIYLYLLTCMLPLISSCVDDLIKQSKKNDKKKAAEKKKASEKKKAVPAKKGVKVGGAKTTLKNTVAKKKKEKVAKDAVKQKAKASGAKKTENATSKKAKKVAIVTTTNKQKREAQLKSRRGITTAGAAGKSGPLISSSAFKAAIQVEATKLAKAMMKKEAAKKSPVVTKKKKQNNNNGNVKIQFDAKKFSETITKSLAAQLKGMISNSSASGKKNKR